MEPANVLHDDASLVVEALATALRHFAIAVAEKDRPLAAAALFGTGRHMAALMPFRMISDRDADAVLVLIGTLEEEITGTAPEKS